MKCLETSFLKKSCFQWRRENWRTQSKYGLETKCTQSADANNVTEAHWCVATGRPLCYLLALLLSSSIAAENFQGTLTTTPNLITVVAEAVR